MTVDSAYDHVKYLRRKVPDGAPGATLQGCRRFFTDTLYAAGASAQDESDLAGHTVAVAASKYRRKRGADLHHVADMIKFSRKSCQESCREREGKEAEIYLQAYDV